MTVTSLSAAATGKTRWKGAEALASILGPREINQARAFQSQKILALCVQLLRDIAMPVFLMLAVTALMFALTGPASAIGFQFVSIPDEFDRPIEIGIWYPSLAAPTAINVGLVDQNAALDGEVVGANLPLVVISHGSAGWFGDRTDTGHSLAKAGFVAVSLTYPGDNFRDSSDKAGRQMTNRPIVTSKVIDYILNQWGDRDRVDKAKVGIYGFSAGGFTGLVEIGGVPDWAIFARHCKSHPGEGVCKQGVAAYLSSPQAAAMPASTWHHDDRIKAAALASPGFAFAFDPDSLRRIRIPVTLWGGERDAVVPFETNVDYLGRLLPNVVAVREVKNAQHYSFLRPCSNALKEKNLETCSDHPDFDRAAFQEQFNQDLLDFFRTHLMGKTH